MGPSLGSPRLYFSSRFQFSSPLFHPPLFYFSLSFPLLLFFFQWEKIFAPSAGRGPRRLRAGASPSVLSGPCVRRRQPDRRASSLAASLETVELGSGRGIDFANCRKG